jgi:WD40 repeat protein
VHSNQNQPLPYDAVLGGNSPPPIRAAVLGGMAGIQWRLQSNTDKVKITALKDVLRYGDRGIEFLTNLVQTETGLLLWTAYHLLWQADQKNLSFSGKVTLPLLARQKMQKRLGGGKLLEAIALTDKLTLFLTSAGATLTDTNSDRLLWQIDCPTEYAAVSPDRTVLALAWKYQIYLWNLRTGELTQQIEVDRGWVCGLLFSPDSKLITAKVGSDRLINLWDVNSGKSIQQLKGHTASVKSLTFSPDGKLLASGDWNDIIRCWNIDSGKQLKRLEEEDASRRLGESLAFSPDGKLLAAASDRYFASDDAVRLWDVPSGNPRQLLIGHQKPIVSLAFSDDSKLLISESKDKTVNRWNLISGDRDVETQLTTNNQQSIDSINNLALSPDSKLLATSRDNNVVYLWDLKSDKPLKTLIGHQGTIESLAFSADGSLLTTTSRDKTAILWDIEASKPLKTLIGHLHWVSSAVFSQVMGCCFGMATKNFIRTQRLCQKHRF